MSVDLLRRIYKGPVTSCEYIDDNRILIGYGPYLSLLNDESFEVITTIIALKYKVIHKIVQNKLDRNVFFVFGQKSINIIRLTEQNELVSLFDQQSNKENSLIELNDWIFDISCFSTDGKITHLMIICAHNQFIFYNLQTRQVEKEIFCNQKCMLYSAKILNYNDQLDDVIIASGTIFNQVLLWSAITGNVCLTLDGHQGVIFNLDHSYINNYLFSTSDDRSINVWKLNMSNNKIENGDLFTRFYGHDARVWKCRQFIYSNVQYLISIGEDLNCCIWNVDDKQLVYRFSAIRKGSKNIWSLCLNENKMHLITGWADGGLRRFELINYLNTSPVTNFMDTLEGTTDEPMPEQNKLDNSIEWSLNITDNDKDFIRTIQILDGRIICCTNMGALYLIDTNNDSNQNQRLLFKSILLKNYNVMEKVKLKNRAINHWSLAIGTLKGFIYLLNIKLTDKEEISIDCINSYGIEEELGAIESSATATTKSALNAITTGSSKITNILWSEINNRYFLMVCFSFMNGLMHLYELNESNQLEIVARLYLPVCKHRWLTSFILVDLQIEEECSMDEPVLVETMNLIGGDKCGNLYIYQIERRKSTKGNQQESLSDLNETFLNNLVLLEPVDSIKNLTKKNSSISSIYSINQSIDGYYLIICCCKDGFYRVLEFNSNYYDIEEDPDHSNDKVMIEDSEQSENTPKTDTGDSNTETKRTMIKLINKYQINSYIDLIEKFIFNENDSKENDSYFDLDNHIKLALCFYGDKILLWNFHLNRPLFEHVCGGANRSWDFEFKNLSSNESGDVLFKLIYVKNKTIVEAKKLLGSSEINRPVSQIKNHLCQIYHGNAITTCKYLLSGKYLMSGGEDTLLIVTNIEHDNHNSFNIEHKFHLQGHDSVVRCIGYIPLNPINTELLLITAGGKANIHISKIILENGSEIQINKIIHLYEFKRFNMNNKKIKNTTSPSSDQNDSQSANKNEKPWLYVDLKSNPDIRFMDVVIFKIDESSNEFIICFACSDGLIRIFKYNLETNKLYLVNKYTHDRCLFCLRYLRVNTDIHLVGCGTDGYLFTWKFNLNDSVLTEKFEKPHQSGINDMDIYKYENEFKYLIATVGDDTKISIVELKFENNLRKSCVVAEREMAHASAVVGIRFIDHDLICSVSKDQRLIIWKIDFNSKSIHPLRVVFSNVADISSLDTQRIMKASKQKLRMSIVGIGLEIIEIDIDELEN